MKKLLATAVAIGLVGMTGSAMAITDNEANASLPFSFSSPGARALGMGGAFIGLADDASAAYANPAGLTQLVSPEVSAEIRSVRTDTRWVDGGSPQYNPFNSSGLNYGSQNDTTSSLRSFSFVYPGERLSFAVYRYELVNYDSQFESRGENYGVDGYIFAFDVNTSIDVETYGVALGYKATDKLSFGVGLNYYLLDISSTTDRFQLDGSPINRESNLNGDGKAGITLGARYSFNETLSAGFSYRRAPELRYDAVLLQPGTANEFARVRTDFDIPDVIGIGLSYRPSDVWVINFDVNRVYYSQLTDNITSVFDEDVNLELVPLKLDDGTEVHLGAEYTFATAHPISLRAGVWRDPAHELVYQGVPSDIAVNAATFSAGRYGSQTHYSIGAGMAFAKFQIDLGADFSDSNDTLSMSGVFRF